MKKFVLLFTILLFISCKQEVKTDEKRSEATATTQTPEQLGKELFEGTGNCVACHHPTNKVIGPSITEIAQIYKQKNGNMISFLQGNEEPIVDPSQYEVMKTNFAITKNMTDEQLKAIEAYMYSYIK